MGLAVALHLRDFDERLQAGAGARILRGDRLSSDGIDQREHQSVRQVAVMRNGEHAAAGLRLVGLQRLPEVLGIVAL